MKYQITKTDLQINGKLHSEGSEVELTKEQTKGIEDYLIPLQGHPEPALPAGRLDSESDSKSHPGQVYAERSRSIEGSQTNVVKKIKTKRNKK